MRARVRRKVVLSFGALAILVALGITVALAANAPRASCGGADEDGNIMVCAPSGSASAFPAAFGVILLGAGAGLGHEILRSGGVVTLPRRVNGGQFHLGSLVGALVGALGALSVVALSGEWDAFPLGALGGFMAKGTAESLPGMRKAGAVAREASSDDGPVGL